MEKNEIMRAADRWFYNPERSAQLTMLGLIAALDYLQGLIQALGEQMDG